jgi:hypothetical protein
MMAFAEERRIVLSANFHGGAEVVNYPWDTWARRHVDDAWLIHLSRGYADAVHAVAPAGYLTDLDNGITNGWDWYPVAGGRQDYMTWFRGGRETTIEISSTKLLPASQLDDQDGTGRAARLPGPDEDGIRGLVTDPGGEPSTPGSRSSVSTPRPTTATPSPIPTSATTTGCCCRAPTTC